MERNLQNSSMSFELLNLNLHDLGDSIFEAWDLAHASLDSSHATVDSNQPSLDLNYPLSSGNRIMKLRIWLILHKSIGELAYPSVGLTHAF
ncbi:hypothetical protein U1Q18_028557 [Sarracenia purpurea var. burkii]